MRFIRATNQVICWAGVWVSDSLGRGVVVVPGPASKESVTGCRFSLSSNDILMSGNKRHGGKAGPPGGMVIY
jgi:hypothetical protein